MANLCTDAGHGAADSGAVWADTREKDLNLLFVKALNDELKQRGHTVFTTRKDDVVVPPLITRCRMINKHHYHNAPRFDAVVSIHCNVAAERQADGAYKAVAKHRGFYAIYSKESDPGTKLATAIADRCRQNEIYLAHRGKISTLELGRTLAWIHKTSPPATLLELGFMTNPDDLALLKSVEYQKKMAKIIADGIDDYLKL